MNGVVKALKRLHRDERGAEMVEKILIIVAIALPLLALLIYFRDWLADWVGSEANTIRGDADNFQSQF